MDDKRFLDVRNRVENGDDIWIRIGSGKYCGSVLKAIDTKTHTTYNGTDYGYEGVDGYGKPGRQYEDYKIKCDIKGKSLWFSRWHLSEDNKSNAQLVIKNQSLKAQNKEPPKDFLGREFTIEDVVFLYSSTYGEMLGVINDVNDIGTLTIRVAKRQQTAWLSQQAKQGVFKVPYERTNRILIIDDPAILLLRA